MQGKPKGVSGLIEIENPNRVVQKTKKASEVDAEDSSKAQLSRRERFVMISFYAVFIIICYLLLLLLNYYLVLILLGLILFLLPSSNLFSVAHPWYLQLQQPF